MLLQQCWRTPLAAPSPPAASAAALPVRLRRRLQHAVSAAAMQEPAVSTQQQQQEVHPLSFKAAIDFKVCCSPLSANARAPRQTAVVPTCITSRAPCAFLDMRDLRLHP